MHGVQCSGMGIMGKTGTRECGGTAAIAKCLLKSRTAQCGRGNFFGYRFLFFVERTMCAFRRRMERSIAYGNVINVLYVSLG